MALFQQNRRLRRHGIINGNTISKKEINANTHRRYTHQGWRRTFSGEDEGETKADQFMDKRNAILLSTVNKIFDFHSFPLIGKYDEQCDALCALIYYVHILGDYDEADNFNKLALLIPLAGSSDGWDIISQLQKYLPILLKNEKQSKDPKYQSLMDDLKDLSREAKKYANDSEKFDEYHKCSQDLMTLLKDDVPYLLKQEPFFKEVFYPSAS